MSTLLRRSPFSTECEVRARVVHLCDWCGGNIHPGDLYVLVTEYPGGDAGYADSAGHPVRMAVHRGRPCYYGANQSGGSE